MTTPARFTVKQARKQALKARISLDGPAGSGKTYTGLALATALAAPVGGTITVIDTEHRRASLYADLFVFDTVDDLTDYSPGLLIEVLSAVADSEVVMIDSLSHFWMGSGGMLESVDAAAKRNHGNGMAGWKDMRPIERAMVEAIIAFPGHVIATMRTKTDFVEETDARGKKSFKRVGLKAEQREGLEYEFDIVGNLSLDNDLTVSKSRCPALSGAIVNKAGLAFAETLLGWLNSGEAGVTAADLLGELAAPNLDRAELRAIWERARAGGILGAAVPGPHGVTGLGDLITSRATHAPQTPAGGGTQPEGEAGKATPPAADPLTELKRQVVTEGRRLDLVTGDGASLDLAPLLDDYARWSSGETLPMATVEQLAAYLTKLSEVGPEPAGAEPDPWADDPQTASEVEGDDRADAAGA